MTSCSCLTACSLGEDPDTANMSPNRCDDCASDCSRDTSRATLHAACRHSGETHAPARGPGVAAARPATRPPCRRETGADRDRLPGAFAARRPRRRTCPGSGRRFPAAPANGATAGSAEALPLAVVTEVADGRDRDDVVQSVERCLYRQGLFPEQLAIATTHRAKLEAPHFRLALFEGHGDGDYHVENSITVELGNAGPVGRVPVARRWQRSARCSYGATGPPSRPRAGTAPWPPGRPRPQSGGP